MSRLLRCLLSTMLGAALFVAGGLAASLTLYAPPALWVPPPVTAQTSFSDIVIDMRGGDSACGIALSEVPPNPVSETDSGWMLDGAVWISPGWTVSGVWIDAGRKAITCARGKR